MHDLFTPTDPALQPLASDCEVPTIEPLSSSSWVAASAMQKGIRRGDVDLTLRAAATLLKSDPAKLWRRLAGIVFEDVGLASVDTIRLVMAATRSKSLREEFGGEWAVASRLVEQMAISPKCRSTDDLLWAISQHHELDELRASLAGVDLPEYLSRIRDRGALLGASLAFELLLHTGLRVSDAVRLGPQHLKKGVHTIVVQKTKKEVYIPLHVDLVPVLDSITDKHLTYLATRQGRSRSSQGLTNYVIDAAKDAGLPPHRSAHGLRKAICIRLAEAGCDPYQIMAITGHQSLAEVQTYIAGVNKLKLAQEAMDSLPKMTA